MTRMLCVCVVTLTLFGAWSAAAQPPARDPYLRPEGERRWKAIPDDPYMQERGEKVVTDKPVTSIAVAGHTAYAVMDNRVYALEGGKFVAAKGAPKKVEKVFAPDGNLFATGKKGTYRFTNGAWTKVDNREYVDMIMFHGAVHGATVENVYRWEKDGFVCIEPPEKYRSSEVTFTMEDGTQILMEAVEFGPLRAIAEYSDTLYGLRAEEALRPKTAEKIPKPGLALFDGATIVDQVADWGTMLPGETRDILAVGSRLFIATDKGLSVLRGMAFTAIQGKDGLPYEDTTCLAEGFDQDLWIGTTRGAARMTGNEFHYFARDRWLPGDNVHGIAVDGKTVYIATDKGVGIIHYEPYTLAKKAAFFEQFLVEYGEKRLGFVQALTWDKDKKQWARNVSDNDGGNTGHYLAAMSFKYAATGDEAARREAVETFKAMAWLEEITGVPGLPARSIWCDEDQYAWREGIGSGGLPPKWNKVPNTPWQWKGDTSSDEIIAHFYAVSVFHDMAARGPEKARAAEHLRRIAHHIIDNGWHLRDVDGKNTRWGRWEPDYLFRPYGMYARGLNGMQAQTFVITVDALTGGDEKCAKGLAQLMEWGYQTHTVRQKVTFPPSEIAPWDDRLAFDAYFPLLRYTKDPHLRSIYMRSLERSWEIKRMEGVAWFNFMYGAITGNDCEADAALRDLRSWPLDMENHFYSQAHRADLAPLPNYPPYGGGTRAIPAREAEPRISARTTLPYEIEQKFHTIQMPVGWLEDYWMGRYYGFIQAPATTDPELLTPPPFVGPLKAPPPYAGPPRPAISMP